MPRGAQIRIGCTMRASDLLQRRCALLCVLFAFASALVVHAAGAGATLMHPRSMAYVQANPAQRTTLFYFSSDVATAPALLAELEEAARHFDANPPQGAQGWQWVSIDCSDDDSKADCAKAGFAAGNSWLFTSTGTEGIQPYQGPKDASSIEQHVRFKFLPADTDAVRPFVDELALFERLDREGGKPIFIKFWEEWCTHCKSIKTFFEQAGTFFRSQVEFLEVECSRTDTFQSFCRKHGVGSFPTLMLFDSDFPQGTPVKFAEATRTIRSFDAFFQKHLPVEKYTSMLPESSTAATAAATEGTKADSFTSESKAAELRKKKKKSKKKKAKEDAEAAAAAAALTAAEQAKRDAVTSATAATTAAAAVPDKQKQVKTKNSKKKERRATKSKSVEKEIDEEEDEDEEREEVEEQPVRRRRSAASRRRRRSRDDEDDEQDDDEGDEDDLSESGEIEVEEQPRRRRSRRRSSSAASPRRSRRSLRRSRYDDDEEDDDALYGFDDGEDEFDDSYLDEEDAAFEAARARRRRRQRRRARLARRRSEEEEEEDAEAEEEENADEDEEEEEAEVSVAASPAPRAASVRRRRLDPEATQMRRRKIKGKRVRTQVPVHEEL